MLLSNLSSQQDVDPNGDPAENIKKLNENLSSVYSFLNELINPENSPVLEGANLLDLDKSRLTATNRRAKLESVRRLSDFISGKKNEITVKDDGNGGVQLSVGRNVGSGSGLKILDTDDYDQWVFTFTNAFLTKIEYLSGGGNVETVNITYDAYNQPVTATSVVGGKTITISYSGNGFPTGAVLT